MTKITHITTVHLPFDTRIFHKECRTLADAGYQVALIAQHDRNEMVGGINILGLPRPKNRFNRIFGLTCRALQLACKEDAAVYHFHDPELLAVGLLLKSFTRGRVIYDVHEDIPQQILSKHWIPAHIRRPIAIFFNIFEKLAVRSLDGVVVATESIAIKFARFNPVVIHNYPDLHMLPPQSQTVPVEKDDVLIYIGGISEIRGAFEMVRAFENLDPSPETRLELIGRFEPGSLEEQMQNLPGYRHVRFLGWLSWEKAWQRAQNAIAGIVLFHPVPNHIMSLPNKLFEYMATGLPIIASNFPLWKDIIETNHCGLTVDPLNPKEISEAIKYLIQHPDEARLMGERGRKAAVERYNWVKEGEKLLSLYGELLKR
jgi:glycosyltransferase involved in cell wall biosynthesis